MAKSKTWKVEFVGTTVKFITRADDMCRQRFDVAELPENIRDQLAPIGAAARLQERCSDVLKANIVATMQAREEVWELWLQGKYAKDREKLEPLTDLDRALAALAGTDARTAQKQFASLTADEQEALRDSEEVNAKIAELATKPSVNLLDILKPHGDDA